VGKWSGHPFFAGLPPWAPWGGTRRAVHVHEKDAGTEKKRRASVLLDHTQVFIQMDSALFRNRFTILADAFYFF
jgi:hypothetical protein